MFECADLLIRLLFNLVGMTCVNTSPLPFSNSVSVGSVTFPSLVSRMKEAFEGDNANGNKFLRPRCQHDLNKILDRGWWSGWGLNPRPPARQTSALLTELTQANGAVILSPLSTTARFDVETTI